MKLLFKIALVTLLSFSVERCAQLKQYCLAQLDFCIFVVLAVGGLAIAGLAGSGALYPYYVYSDSRLKTDLTHFDTLNNGIKVYSFRYKGDDRYFYGVVAQDLLKDRRFRKAVTKDSAGYYQVNYAKLGLKLVNGKLMADLGKAAARIR